jgi:hypothetical protein
MNGISITNVIGYARIAVILGIGGALITGRMDLLTATATLAFLQSSLGALALFYTKDDKDADAQISVKQVGDQITVKATAQDVSTEK